MRGEHQNPSGQTNGFADVVGDEDDRLARLRHTGPAAAHWSMSLVMASRAANGSSINKTWRSWAKALARATRWRMPPESSWGFFSMACPSCTS